MTAYIGLGTNLGDRKSHLHRALRLLDSHRHVVVERLSSIYETDPVGYLNQEKFLNMAAKVSTTLTPNELLDVISHIERELGRKRAVRWGPRTIDLDILLYDRLHIKTERLQIPHPRMCERAFVLIPLAEIAPDVCIPGARVSPGQRVKQISDKEGVRLWKQNSGEGKFALFES
ncbi:MAG TPA: 2-amino-4-hydroxy-6-hydroxymethyldihydropteridine diphosphokinase [Bacillales bacterium]|nr:2-amino-4-hydroxy-6-hydroxymethyldihydropteridine diphosphokinase [Bacillales bacterium]